MKKFNELSSEEMAGNWDDAEGRCPLGTALFDFLHNFASDFADLFYVVQRVGSMLEDRYGVNSLTIAIQVSCCLISISRNFFGLSSEITFLWSAA